MGVAHVYCNDELVGLRIRMVCDTNIYIIDFVEPWIYNKGKVRSTCLGLR